VGVNYLGKGLELLAEENVILSLVGKDEPNLSLVGGIALNGADNLK
jgi:hypothetical protein